MKNGSEDECKKTCDEIAKLDKRIRSMPAEEVAYKIIRLFNDTPEVSEELRAQYHEWLLDGNNCEAKDKAMFRVFQEEFKPQEPTEETRKRFKELQVRLNLPVTKTN